MKQAQVFQEVPVHAITRSYQGISPNIISKINIRNPISGEKKLTLGIWDTGATNTVITKQCAQELNLPPIGKAVVKGVHSTKEVSRYPLEVFFSEKLHFIIQVTECDKLIDDDSCNLLIGMDIITKGDFIITNFGGNTTMSFRVPSLDKVDFIEEFKAKDAPKEKYSPSFAKNPGRNDPCPCGSGHKYKHCHGKTE